MITVFILIGGPSVTADVKKLLRVDGCPYTQNKIYFLSALGSKVDAVGKGGMVGNKNRKGGAVQIATDNALISWRDVAREN